MENKAYVRDFLLKALCRQLSGWAFFSCKKVLSHAAINIYLPLTAVTTPADAACYNACNKAAQRISPRGTGTYEKGVMKKINVEMNVGFI